MALLRQTLRRRRALRVFNAAVVFAWLGALAAPAATIPTREQQIKAATFCNLIAFAEWPESAFASADSPLVVGVLGKEDIVTLLENFLANETWHGRRVTLRRISTSTEARSCHVLYVEASAYELWRTLNNQFARLPILTVSDAQDFARTGGVVQLAIQRNKLRLIVNLRVARDCKIAISSKVLRLADVLDDAGP